MKKKYLSTPLTLLAMLAFLMVGCNKDTVVLKARFENYSNDSKLYLDNNRYSHWNNGDQIYVNGYWYTLGDNATVEVYSSTQYVAYYVTPNTIGSNNGAVTFDVPQTVYYTLDGNNQKVMAPMYANSPNTTINFKNMGAILAINLSNQSDYSSLTISWVDVTATNINLWGTATIDDSDPSAPTYSCAPASGDGSDPKTIRLDFSNTPLTLADGQSRTVYVSVPPVPENVENRYSIRVHAYQGGNVLEYHRAQPATALYAGSIHRSQWANVPFSLVSTDDVETVISSANLPAGIFDYSSQFSVSASTKVYFSQGNLQYYVPLAGETGYWRFAPTQTTTIGSANIANLDGGGFIDLFGWGTAGWQSNANHTAYLPTSTSTTPANYYVGGAAANSLTGNYVRADWGYNDITNGRLPDDNTGTGTIGKWRTLTNLEFHYLLGTGSGRNRRYVDGISGHNGRNFDFDLVTYNGQLGLIIYPDATSDVTATPAQGQLGSPQYQVHGATFSNSTTDVYTISTIPAGCVFLPAAEQRRGTTMCTDAGVLAYWTASPNSTNAVRVGATQSGSEATGYTYTFGVDGTQRYLGLPVRLVTNVE